jgi:hypothetical protein
MFEGWASNFLATYLGQFLDLQREKLRISLWSGELPTLSDVQMIPLHVSASLASPLPRSLAHRTHLGQCRPPPRRLSSPAAALSTGCRPRGPHPSPRPLESAEIPRDCGAVGHLPLFHALVRGAVAVGTRFPAGLGCQASGPRCSGAARPCGQRWHRVR